MSQADQFGSDDAQFESNKRGLSYGGIALGVVADVVATFAMGIVLGIVMGVMLARPGMSPEQFQEDMLNSQNFWYLTILISTIGSLIGGLVAAKIAKHDGLKHGALTGALSAALSVSLVLAFDDPTPTWATGIAIALAIPAAALGGFLGCSKNE